ncbi:MAG: sugar transferase [Candidatus Omnitrophica bacterium]|nr:sugar transferase [Candidatus Omnitrophota bacterium]MDE2215313.1 sugar transferase [Candidatus Omnitrophota bacterium]MDE2232142.1 sugar transferase [Candidatus Omnitrophota bacterium]
MKSQLQSTLIVLAYSIIDIGFILLSFYLVLLFRSHTVAFSISWQSIFSDADPFRTLFVVWTLFILFFHYTHGLYQTRREQLETLEIWEVVKSTSIATLSIIVIAFLLRIEDFPRSVMVLNAVVISFFCSMWRVLKRLWVNYLVSRGYNNFNTLIIGAGRIGVALAGEIGNRPALGLKVKGFLDDHKTGKVNGWPVLGKLDGLQEIIHREFIQQIFITIYPDHQTFIKLLEIARGQSLAVRVVPQGYEYMSNDFIRFNIGIIPILEYSDINISYRQRLKRVFDFVLSLAALVFLMPVFIALAFIIKLDSPGPVFYRSRRYGCYARCFDMYKFRSMVVNADEMLGQLKDKNEVDGPIFKIKKDPRITPIGAFLRRWSLDELPQILNVLKGDMSLVGPRPFPIAQLEKEDLRQLKRLGIRPGITGLWQVRGRSDVSFEKLLRWDIWYIKNWSFGLDLYILFQTFPVVIKGKGAY